MIYPYKKVNKWQDYVHVEFISISLIAVALGSIIGYTILTSPEKLFHFSIVPLFAGLIFEYYRIVQKWRTVLSTSLFAFFFSLVAFFPSKKESSYILASHIEAWPFYFLGFFILAIIYDGKGKKPLTEGITLMQSIAIIYWSFDCGLVQDESMFSRIILGLGGIFCLFAILNALFYVILSDAFRLILSAWSSVIMLIFALENIFRVSDNGEIEYISVLSQQLFVALQYFLLGISSIYIATNIVGLFAFFPFPFKERFFNQQYINDLKALHIERYSERQVNPLESLVCILLLSSIFYFNYQYQFLPRHIITWISFIFIPMILSIFSNIRQQNRRR